MSKAIRRMGVKTFATHVIEKGPMPWVHRELLSDKRMTNHPLERKGPSHRQEGEGRANRGVKTRAPLPTGNSNQNQVLILLVRLANMITDSDGDSVAM
jgi:hypothetical protein